MGYRIKRHAGKTAERVFMDDVLRLDLQLFADGEGEAGASETAEVGVDSSTAEAQTADVPKEQTAQDIEAEFESLIKDKYKDAFTKRTQTIIDKRFKTAKQAESKLEKLTPFLSEAAKRYGKEADDFDGISQAFLDDNLYIEHLAVQQGKSVEDVRASIKNDAQRAADNAELQRLRGIVANIEAEDENRVKFNAWLNESESLKTMFPSLDFRAEMQSKEFIGMLEALTANGFNNPFERAYKTMHMDELVTSVASTTAQKVAQATANKIASGVRPSENGNSDSVASVSKINVDTLSNKDVLDILKKVERGERISF